MFVLASMIVEDGVQLVGERTDAILTDKFVIQDGCG